ncbi:MAG TPA: glutamate--tRNA ligase, partial [Spirochaetia bacterium]|nr:glutamate--tRNA ligase [Spirochaetia bacterium]
MSVRVRYAPSPTGLQHIGGLRTALFNYLFAKARGGKFYLRIEDTDQGRYNPEAEADLYDSLRWAGLDWDEGPDKGGPFGPYVQSQRLEHYTAHARTLVESGAAYECFCSSARLDALRQDQEKAKLPQGYDRHCRHLTEAQRNAERAQATAEGRQPVVRFAMPLEGSTTVEDEILGLISKQNADLPVDPVILKSDGFPTYHLAHVVDDHAMETTHVLRAQEWLPSAFLHVLMFQASGYSVPRYVHLPLILGQDGQKLSKRHGATSVKQFRADGYTAEGLVNYLALLGWSYDDSREFFTLKELEEVFSLDRLSKSPAVFDYKKLEHFNGHAIRQLTKGDLKGAILPSLVDAGLVANPLTADQDATLEGFLPLVQERLKFLKDAPEALRFVWNRPTTWVREDFVPKKLDEAAAKAILTAIVPLLDAAFDGRGDEENEHVFRARGEELGYKLGDFMQPLRVAVTGSRVSPPMF